MNRVAVVTGAGGNMGRALVQQFLNDGCTVVGADASAPAHPVQYEAHAVNLMDETAASDWVNELVARHTRIDVAVLTVGGFAMGGVADTKTSDIAQQYRLNFETTYNVARPVFLQMMKRGSGRLFLVGARPALSAEASRGMLAYGLAKSLVFRLAEMMNDEAKSTDVAVHVIVPSIIDTPQNRAAMPTADFTRWVRPEQIAQAVSFHASEQGQALRGSVIKVYGGA